MSNALEISQLIYKSVIGTLTPAEQSKLNDWLSDPDNREFYQSILEKNKLERKFENFEQFRADIAWEKIKSKIKERSTLKRTPFLPRWSRYAAAVLLLMTVGTLFWLKTKNTPDLTADQGIVPGSAKALLKLSDGNIVNLAEFPGEDKIPNAVSRSGEIAYKTISGTGEATDELHVPIGGEYKVVLADGSKVWLNSGSTLKYPVAFSGEQRNVILSGEGYFEVAKDDKPFIVNAGGVDIKVLGTSFNIRAYQNDDRIITTLIEGRIEIKDHFGKLSSVFLEPGNQAIFQREEQEIIKLQSDNPAASNAWTNGKFDFNNESLEEIMTQLSRWYNCKVEFRQEHLKDKLITGIAFRDRPVNNVMEMLSKVAHFQYQVNENKIIIDKK